MTAGCNNGDLQPQVSLVATATTNTTTNINVAADPADDNHDHYDAAEEENQPPPEENDPLDERKILVISPVAASVGSSASQPPVDAPEEFIKALKERRLEIQEQEGDGNCLFRAVSLQIYGDPSMHAEVRKRCLDFMAKEEQHFSHFVENEPFQDYINRKKQDGVHGNNPEIQAISELYNRPVEVFTPENGAKPLNIFQSEYKTSDAPIRLSYHDGNHYNAVVDPFVPTAGLGLGLPGLQPGLADKMQMAKAVRESDQLADQMELEQTLKKSQDDLLQRAIKESAISVDRMHSDKAVALSDLDATNFELEQAVLESSLDAYNQSENGRKQRATEKQPRPEELENKPNSKDSFPITSSSPPVAAAVPPVASVPAAASVPLEEPPTASAFLASLTPDQYPQTVQELVMNGFELPKVVKAYELIGDNFDDLLSFLVTNH
eukprot:CAMPEP_0202453098 /NCGR_PEP_ID=MMETSP1360-20130828/11147_1 /ASSEMBLY_ACC=CAM_ASM_000848 /TAXON_ID=515479 /ORGANISM="Licmophora paradoxa, Strain CCMP2313" /LENGTH=435 /DNA_ID=CAMNT_0049072095 /DNA_START=170 /DNA_END=1480 /DNA_ORIENTATION=+